MGFHIRHIQSESRGAGGGIKEDAEPSDDSDGDDGVAGDVKSLTPDKLKPSQSVDTANLRGGKGSVFARPNLKKKQSAAVLTEKQRLAARRKSSRFLMSQEQRSAVEVRKQRSNTPAIIQPSNYQQRKSGKRASHLVQPTTERKKEKEK